MADVVGVDHVGLGTDLLGLGGPSTLPGYADLPQLAAALRTKFNADETAKLLGGNYRRVFQASVGCRHHTSVKAAGSLAACNALG